MAPRKSNVSIVSNGPGDDTTTDAAPTPNKAPPKDGVGIDDLTLPKSMIARLAKGVLPPNTQIQKDALLALHKSATVFVSYIANSANEFTQANMKKTIMPQDVITAIKDAEFESFLPRLQAELKKYNDIQSDKRNSYRNRVKQEKATTSTTSGPKNEAATDDVSMTLDDTVATVVTNGGNDEAERPSKKLKGAEGKVVLPTDGDDSNILVLGNDSVDKDIGSDEDEADEDDDDEEDESEDDESDDEAASDSEIEDEQGDPPDSLRDPNGFRDEALDDPDSD